MFRIGLGQDSHKLKQGGKVILGGIEVSCKYHLEAHSDGDVIIHSLCNALSSVIGGGSLDTWAGAMYEKGIHDSRQFLTVVVQKIRESGYKIANISVAVEAQKPRLEIWRETMQKSIASLVGIEKNQVGITFTSGERLTSFGRGEGIQVISIVLIEK